jgi:hypothetical protein
MPMLIVSFDPCFMCPVVPSSATNRTPLVFPVYQNQQGPPRRQSQKPFVFNHLSEVRTGFEPAYNGFARENREISGHRLTSGHVFSAAISGVGQSLVSAVGSRSTHSTQIFHPALRRSTHFGDGLAEPVERPRKSFERVGGVQGSEGQVRRHFTAR